MMPSAKRPGKPAGLRAHQANFEDGILPIWPLAGQQHLRAMASGRQRRHGPACESCGRSSSPSTRHRCWIRRRDRGADDYMNRRKAILSRLETFRRAGGGCGVTRGTAALGRQAALRPCAVHVTPRWSEGFHGCDEIASKRGSMAVRSLDFAHQLLESCSWRRVGSAMRAPCRGIAGRGTCERSQSGIMLAHGVFKSMGQPKRAQA